MTVYFSQWKKIEWNKAKRDKSHKNYHYLVVIMTVKFKVNDLMDTIFLKQLRRDKALSINKSLSI